MKKRHSLLLLPFICLCSCSKVEYSGRYSFMLGRQGESRVGIALDLKNEDFVYQKTVESEIVLDHDALVAYDKTKLKDGDYVWVLDDAPAHEGDFYYSFDLATNSFKEYGENPPRVKATEGKKFKMDFSLGAQTAELPEMFKKIIDGGITGYYNPTEYENPNYGKRISIGTLPRKEFIPGLQAIYDFFKDEFGEAIANAIEEIIESSDGRIEPELIQKIAVAYCDGKNFTIQIPVSMEDLQQQLTWYGLYFDIDPEVKAKIHSLDDLFSNIVEVLSSIRSYNLAEHKEKFLRDGETELRTVQLVGGDSIQGDNRTGTHPGDRIFRDAKGKYTSDSRDDAQKDKDKQDDISGMNYHYGNEFSNTFVYANSDGTDLLGAITSKRENNETKYYFYDRKGFTDLETKKISGYVATADEYGIYNIYKNVDIDFNIYSLKDYELGLSIKDVKNAGIETNLDYEKFYQTPFVFRDQHDIKVGLAKER